MRIKWYETERREVKQMKLCVNYRWEHLYIQHSISSPPPQPTSLEIYLSPKSHDCFFCCRVLCCGGEAESALWSPAVWITVVLWYMCGWVLKTDSMSKWNRNQIDTHTHTPPHHHVMLAVTRIVSTLLLLLMKRRLPFVSMWNDWVGGALQGAVHPHWFFKITKLHVCSWDTKYRQSYSQEVFYLFV